MKLGEKIKLLRSEKMMTQTELAGEVVTRNMLSCIENGKATPSLETLRHIAAKLNVSVGYLLADENDEKIYKKMTEIANIKNAYLSGNHRICRDMCQNSAFENDDEINLLYSECCLGIAIELFDSGRLHKACGYFDEALEVAARTIYNTGHIVSLAASYFRYMRRISATLSSDIIDENEADIYSALSDDFARYSLAFEAVESSSFEIVEKLVCVWDKSSVYNLHIEAKADMMEERYSDAYSKLYAILTSPVKIQEPIMYFVFCDLEICCKEIKDFKGAYEYSNDKLELFQKLLTDN